VVLELVGRRAALARSALAAAKEQKDESANDCKSDNATDNAASDGTRV
jgi:hypothetical protein